MYLTNEEFEAIEKALKLLPHGNVFVGLSEEKQDIIINADKVMVNLLKKKKANNKKVAEYIAEKRKSNKNYARSKKEKEVKKKKENNKMKKVENIVKNIPYDGELYHCPNCGSLEVKILGDIMSCEDCGIKLDVEY